MTDNFGVRSPSNPFVIGEFVNFKFNNERFYNAQYIGQLSPYDIDDDNPLLLFETFEGRKLRIKLKAIYILEFAVRRPKGKGIGLKLWVINKHDY